MAHSRYTTNTPVLGSNPYRGTSRTVSIIRSAILTGDLSYTQRIVTGVERLDTAAGREYGDGRYWWILAAASNIGWGLQIPPGTILYIPSLSDVLLLVS